MGIKSYGARLLTREFRTHLVTKFVSLYLMNFMFHTMLDAVGNIRRVHYKSIKYDVAFYKVV